MDKHNKKRLSKHTNSIGIKVLISILSAVLLFVMIPTFTGLADTDTDIDNKLIINIDEDIINRYFSANIECDDLTSVLNGEVQFNSIASDAQLSHADYLIYDELVPSGDFGPNVFILSELYFKFSISDTSLLLDPNYSYNVVVNGVELFDNSMSGIRDYGSSQGVGSWVSPYPELAYHVVIGRDYFTNEPFLSLSFMATFGEVSMYRLYNPNSGEHFYTSNVAERDMLISVGWSDEGIGWIAPSYSNTPVYRLYNQYGGEHHYTTNAAERDMLISAGWNDEGIGWYSDDAQTVPLYRQYNPNAFANNHNYTTSLAENDYLVSLGWQAEGIGWYGIG